MGSVRRDKCRDDPDPTMGYDRDLDKNVWVGFWLIPSSRRRYDVDYPQISQRMGVLGVQYRIWTFPGSVLCVRADNDG